MRTSKNTETQRQREYNCAWDAFMTTVFLLPAAFLVVASGGNPVLLGLVGVVVVFGILIARAE